MKKLYSLTDRAQSHSKAITGGKPIGCGDMSIIKIGGNGRNIVVGENAKWYLRNKFHHIEIMSEIDSKPDNYDRGTIKELLKMVGLKMPITFEKSLTYEKIKPESKHTDDEITNDKLITLLDARLARPVNCIIKYSTVEYKLRKPLFVVLEDIIKYLVFLLKKNNKDFKKIDIPASLLPMMDDIWGGKQYFKFDVYSNDIPENMVDLTVHILDLLKDKPNTGTWEVVDMKPIKFPTLSKAERDNIESQIKKKIDKLNDKMKKKKIHGAQMVKEYIVTMLTIEHLLMEHLVEIEQYYISVTKDMVLLLSNLKLFFGVSSKDSE